MTTESKPTTPTPKQTRCQHCPLKTLDVFRVVSPEELGFIEHFKTGEFVTDAGTAILLEGTNSAHLYTVLSGWAFRYKMLPDGRRQILNFVMPGDFIGLQGSMLNEMQHSVESLTQMILCVFPREKLWSLYSKHPSLAFDLTWLAARSERLLDENLLSVGRRSALERLGYVLLDLFYRGKHLGLAQGSKIKFPFTQEHIADALGLSLVHTNKTLRVLIDRKLVRWKGGVFELVEPEKLAELSHYVVSTPGLRPLI
ncbi:MAG: Crp/Fnr family transcriptional regulator [Hyphomicrobium sp.]